MSKEQLGEIMHDFRQKLALGHVNINVLNSAAEIHELVIEQAERVQGLEKQNEIMLNALKAIEQQPHYSTIDGIMNAHAKEAIKEYYAIKREFRGLRNEN